MPKISVRLPVETIHDLFVGTKKLHSVRFRTKNGNIEDTLSSFQLCTIYFEADRDILTLILSHPEALHLVPGMEIPKAEIVIK